MVKNLGNHPGFLDGDDDFQFAHAVRAVFDVDIEYPFTKILPGFRPTGRRLPFKIAPGDFVSSRAQLMRTDAEEWGASSWASEVFFAFFCVLGIISERSLAFGASIP